MRQQSFLNNELEKYQKKTRKQLSLEQKKQIIPWHKLIEAISPYYPKEPKGVGRKPVGLLRMLKVHFLQHGFELSDPAAEEALYAPLPCVGLFALTWAVSQPGGNHDLYIRHLMEKINLGDELFRLVNVHLSESGLKVRRGTIVYASIINALTSTKNKRKQRDPDMHQIRKGNQWYFGMKAHIGVDSHTKLFHSIAATPANVHDSQVLGDGLHSEETRVWGDSASVLQETAPRAKDFTQKKGCKYKKLRDLDRARNRTSQKFVPRLNSSLV